MIKLAILIAGMLFSAEAIGQTVSIGAPPSTASTQKVLGSLRGANFNSTADQAISIAQSVTAFTVTAIYVTNCSTSLTLAAGGFYPAASKGGTPIVSAAQSYTALTAATALIAATMSAAGSTARYTLTTVFMSLTVAQGTAATCDVYVVGVDLT